MGYKAENACFFLQVLVLHSLIDLFKYGRAIQLIAEVAALYDL